MASGDDPDIRSTIPAVLLQAHAKARVEDPSVPPIARPYWIPGGPLSILSMSGVEQRIRIAAGSVDDLALSFIAQDSDFRVRQTAAKNPNMPRILSDAILGRVEYSPEDAAAIWFDVWKTDPFEVLDEHGSEPGIATVLLARGYFAEDFDDLETARRWFMAASSIGVAQGHINFARLSASDNRLKSHPNEASLQMDAEPPKGEALVPVLVSLAIFAVVLMIALMN